MIGQQEKTSLLGALVENFKLYYAAMESSHSGAGVFIRLLLRAMAHKVALYDGVFHTGLWSPVRVAGVQTELMGSKRNWKILNGVGALLRRSFLISEDRLTHVVIAVSPHI